MRKRFFLCIMAALCLLAGCAKAEPKPVLTCEAADYTMDSDQFQYYFGYQYANVLASYGDEAFDPKENLAEQDYDDTQSWQDFLIAQAMTLAEQTARLCLAAQAAEYEPENLLAELDSAAAETAEENGYDDVEDFLIANYGEGATMEGYRTFMQSMALASAYSEQLHQEKTYTDDEIEAFYDSHSEDYADTFQVGKNYDCRMDVRMIRFYPDDVGSEADWTAAEERATEVLHQFWENPTDEAFAALADANTEDYNAPEGGLYELVSPNQMNDALNEWLFPKDTLRAVGDCEWVDDGDACVLCYIRAVEERPYWQIVAENDLRYADYITALSELDTTYTFTQIPENVDLRVPTAHTASSTVPEGAVAVG